MSVFVCVCPQFKISLCIEIELIEMILANMREIKHILSWQIVSYAVVQLRNQMNLKATFVDFTELPITFPPTYKYDPGTDDFDSRFEIHFRIVT